MNNLFTADFTVEPDGPLHGHNPRPGVAWARRLTGSETEHQFVFTSPVIQGGAVVAVPGDGSNKSAIAFLHNAEQDFGPIYPTWQPEWSGTEAADTGELEVRFTLSAVEDFFNDGSAYEAVVIGCLGPTYTFQPFFSFGYDTYISKPQMRFSAWSGVTPAKITLPQHLDLLQFGGAINTGRLTWDRSTIQFILNGVELKSVNTQTRPSPNPTFEVRKYGRVLKVYTGIAEYPPESVGLFWRDLKNAVEDI